MLFRSAHCIVDAIAATTACSPGRRSLLVEDRGSLAATFMAADTGRAVRVVAHAGRASSGGCTDDADAHLRSLPDEALLTVSSVDVPVAAASTRG